MATVIIGTSGFGGAIARRLTALGRPVYLLSRDAARLSALASELRCGSSAVDVRDSAALASALASASSSLPRISGLVYAVGSLPLAPLRRTSAEDVAEAFAVNCLGAIMAVKALAPALAAGDTPGSIVLFSTVAASQGFPNHAAIAAAKGGVEAFTRSAAAELAPRVRVNAIAPSLSDTPLAAKLLASDATRKALGEAHPLPRLGSAEDAAAAALFLLSHEQSGWVTGQVLAVDGGRSTVRTR